MKGVRIEAFSWELTAGDVDFELDIRRDAGRMEMKPATGFRLGTGLFRVKRDAFRGKIDQESLEFMRFEPIDRLISGPRRFHCGCGRIDVRRWPGLGEIQVAQVNGGSSGTGFP